MWNEKVVDSFAIQEEILPGAFVLLDAVAANDSVVLGTSPIDITTPSEQWAFAVTFPFRSRDLVLRGINGPLLIKIEAAIKSGSIGIGCIGSDLRSYVTPEIERTFEDGNTVINVVVESLEGGCSWLVIRNIADTHNPSRVVVRAIRTFKVEKVRVPDLFEVEPPAIPNLVCAPGSAANGQDGANGNHSGSDQHPALSHDNARRFQILVTHTSRSWDLSKCKRDYLIERYADPGRLKNLPAFEDLLPPPTHLYSGGVTILQLDIAGKEARLAALRAIDSRFKVQHASLVGGRLVLCFEHFLLVIPRMDGLIAEIDLQPGSPWRIDDNWFSGLHTVFPVDEDVCLVSSSGADAVLWVDLKSRTVIRRWRLPGDIYGTNYELTPEMSVVEHYIHNDIQLGHLNCAYPDGRGGCYVSTLIQGDIGHVDADSAYSLLDRGHVGCHGVRLSQDGRYVYFTDSCGGRLMRITPGRGADELQSVDSRWLHDVDQVDPDLFLFCLGDKNELVLRDVTRGEEWGRFAMDTRGVNVQFATIVHNSPECDWKTAGAVTTDRATFEYAHRLDSALDAGSASPAGEIFSRGGFLSRPELRRNRSEDFVRGPNDTRAAASGSAQHIAMKEKATLPGFTPAQAYWNQRETLANARERILALSRAVNRPTDLAPFQFAQLMSAALEFGPDVILELGRGNGNSTCAFAEVSNLKQGRIRVVSLCNSDSWDRETLPRLKSVVPKDWFKPLEILRTDILEFDYARMLSRAKRVLLFWDAHGFDIAECVLGAMMPLLAPLPHLVMMHDLSDTRYSSNEQLCYGDYGIWKGNDWSGPRLKIGIIDSAVEQSVAALDFTTRNRVTLDSADHSFRTELTETQQIEMKKLLGELFNLQGHWFYFSLNEHSGPYTFPRFMRPSRSKR